MLREPSVTPDREERLDELVTAYLRAVTAGTMPDRRELLARHPDLAAELEEFFSGQDELDQALAPLRQVARVARMETTVPADATGPEGAGSPSNRAGALPAAFGDYEVLGELGRGGMGVVYRVRQRSLNRLVALKVVRVRDVALTADVQRFRNEAETVGALDHPHIVAVHEVGEYDGYLYFSMRLVEGGSLDSRLTEFVANPRGAARLLAGAAHAVHHAHQRGVLHRDLKPGNILRDAAGEPHITDFGLAKRVETDSGLTQSGTLVGTPSYMAPEQTTGRKGVVTTAGDIYGLGAVLYALLTGRPPFRGETVLDTLTLVREAEPQSPRRMNVRVDRDLETICLKCLRKDPARRYASALALAEDLERYLRREPVQARRIRWYSRAARWIRRRPAPAALAAFLLLAVATGAGAGLARMQREAAAEREAVEALDQADTLHQGKKLPEALLAIRRAEPLATSGLLSEGLARRVRELQDDLELVVELDDIRLESGTPDKMGFIDWDRTDPAYAQSFQKHGLDVLHLSPEAAAERIRRRSVARELAAALQDWAWVCKVERPKEDTTWKHLLAIVRLADPDDWRNQVRAAWERRDPKSLKELAASRPIAQLTPFDLDLLGLTLVRTALYGRSTDPDVVALFRRAQWQHPDDYWINQHLAYALVSQEPPRGQEALRPFAMALALRPRSPMAYVNLGSTLVNCNQGLEEEAVAAFDKAIELKPGFTLAYFNKGQALIQKGATKEAVGAYEKCVELEPDFALGHYQLSVALQAQGANQEALAARRKAAAAFAKEGEDKELDRRFQLIYVRAFVNLGIHLRLEGAVDEAASFNRRALRLQPDCVEAHCNLGRVLLQKELSDEAITEFRTAIRIQPEHFESHLQLAQALMLKALFDEAVVEARTAVRIQPNSALAHGNLALVLREKGDLDAALTQYQEAMRLRPNFALYYYNRGVTWQRKNALQEARKDFLDAIRLLPNYGTAHISLGEVLAQEGDLDGAIRAYRQALELGQPEIKQLNITLTGDVDIQRRLRVCERHRALRQRLPGLLAGHDRPANPAERLEFADLCQQPFERRYALAARLFAEVFVADPKQADDLEAGYRYNAACAAALAGCAQGEDAARLEELEKAQLRGQARAWLRDDMAVWTRQLRSDKSEDRTAAREALQHWQKDTDLAGLRDPAALAKLPATEQEACKKLWMEVATLLQPTRGQP